MSEHAANARNLIGGFVRAGLQVIVRTGQHAALGAVPPRYCGPCARPRLSRLTLWNYEAPGGCADCGASLAAGEGLGCADDRSPI